MTRDELIELGKRISGSEGSEQEINVLCELFDKNVSHPGGSALFFYPENFDARTDDIAEYNPTVEEVIDKCLNYKNIIL